MVPMVIMAPIAVIAVLINSHCRQWITLSTNGTEGVIGAIVTIRSLLSPMDHNCRQWIAIITNGSCNWIIRLDRQFRQWRRWLSLAILAVMAPLARIPTHHFAVVVH